MGRRGPSPDHAKREAFAKLIAGGKLSTRPPDGIRRPLRHRLPVRGLMPTIRHARAEGTPSIITVALGVMGIGLFAITPLADRGVQAELQAEKMHNVGIRVTDVPLTAEQLSALKSLDNVDQMSPQAELLVTIEIGGRRERALLVGIPNYADQAVDVVRITSGEAPRGMQVLTDQGNEANAVIPLSRGDDVSVQDPTGTTNRLLVTGVGKNFIHSASPLRHAPTGFVLRKRVCFLDDALRTRFLRSQRTMLPAH